MSDVPAITERFVRERASDRCEYCGLSQVGQEATFHIDHIVPRSRQGPSDPDNLALACVSCSLRKGARTRSRDPQTKAFVALYHPRTQSWWDHFKYEAGKIVGTTRTGRATIAALRLNHPRLIAIRQFEFQLDRYPPQKWWSVTDSGDEMHS